MTHTYAYTGIYNDMIMVVFAFKYLDSHIVKVELKNNMKNIIEIK